MTKDEAIAKVLETALNGLQKTGEFVVEQAPDLIRQLLLWNTVEYILFLVFGLMFLIGGPLTARKVWKMSAGSDAYDKGGYYACTALSAIIGVMAGVPLVIHNLCGLLKITLAPKIWLLEYAASLVRGAT